MAVAVAKKRVFELGPDSAGARLSPQQFDRAEFAEGWRYELIDGVLVVSPIPSEQERGPNDYLGYLLTLYGESNPEGGALDATLPEHDVPTKKNRRRVDRAIWAGLGRRPRKGELPTVIAEFVSPGKRSHKRDYEEKRDEFMEIGVQQYWIIDRFARTMTVYWKDKDKVRKRVIKEHQVYKTPLLPGFELPLARLLAVADEWE